MKASEGFLLHGNYIKTGDRKAGNERDCYVGVVKSVEDGHTEIIMRENPEISVYVTKPQFRTNTIKKECELKSHCDQYRTTLLRLNDTLYNAINKSMLQLKFCTLEALGQALSDRLLNDTRSGKTDECTGLSQDHISKHCKTCGHTSGRRIGQHGNI